MNEGTRGWRAVVVEDWRVLRSGLSAVLRREGLNVLGETPDIAEALPLCARAELLVVGDGDAAAAATMVRAARDAAPALRIVALLGALTPASVMDTFAAGADAVVGREVTDDELREAVRRLSLGQRYIAGAPDPSLFAAATRAMRGRDVLTPKEQEVLLALARGSSNREIAAQLYVSPATVKTHLSNIYAKLAAGNRHQAVRRALDLGLLAG